MKVCVTGAGGYIGSWLVKSLLQRGYTVSATLRNPKDEAKTGPLLSLPGAAERLKLFQADLCEEDAFDSAVEGCEGVFHVASPMDFSKLSEDDYVQPALKGVLNVLKSSSRAKSVRRVVYTSSVAAACPLNEEGEFMTASTLDESTWTPVDILRKKPHPDYFYSISKTLAEKAAIEYSLNSGQMEVVTILPGYVGGSGIISTFAYSCNEILGPITGNCEGLKSSESSEGCISLVHIDDLCEAHIFLMEQPKVQGRHVCVVGSLSLSQLADFIHKRYPHFTLQFKSDDEDDNSIFVPASSKKLLDMGFSYKYGVGDIFDGTIKWAESYGLLK
jgi:bifunctional dihydroflavonol 4-reductase/flavanone 4-reductase